MILESSLSGILSRWGFLIAVLLLFDCAGLQPTVFIGVLKHSISIAHDETRIYEFQSIASEGTIISSGDFIVSTSGVYYVSVILIVSVEPENCTYSLLISSIPGEPPGLSAHRNGVPNPSSFAVYGAMRLAALEKFSILLRCTCCSPTSMIHEDSTLSLMYLYPVNTLPAFSVTVKRNFQIFSQVSYYFPSWTSTGRQSSFSSTNLFTPGNGLFVVPITGAYLVSANIVIAKKALSCAHHIHLRLNETRILLKAPCSSKAEQTFMTVSFAASFLLEKGSSVFLHVHSENCADTFLTTDSSFSVVYEHQGIGFSLSLPTDTGFTEKGWHPLDVSRFSSSSYGGFSTFEKHSVFPYSFHKSCYVLVAVHIHLSPVIRQSGFRLAVTLNTTPATSPSGTDVLGSVGVISRPSQTPSSVVTLTLSSIVKVDRGDVVKASLFSPSDNHVTMLRTSVISVLVLNPDIIALHGEFSEPLQEVGISWTPLPPLKFDSDLTFQYASFAEYNQSVFKIYQTGIYLVASTLNVEDLIDVSLEFSVMTTGVQKTELLYACESSVTGSVSLRVTSPLMLKSGTQISLQLKTGQSLPNKVSVFGDFGIAYLGYETRPRTTHVYLESDDVMESTGDLTITGYQDPNINHKSFDNGNHFQFNAGTFEVAEAGVYMISANVIVKEANLMQEDSMFSIFISVKGNHTSRHLSSDRSRKLKKNPYDRFTTFSASITSSVFLNVGDSVCVKLRSRSDSRIVIDKRTSFSVVYLGPSPGGNGFLSFLPRIGLAGNRLWKTISGWSVDPMGKSEDVFIALGARIQVGRSGLYLISFHLSIERSAEKQFRASIVRISASTETTFNEQGCAEKSNPYKLSTLGCSLLVFAATGSEYEVRIFSPEGVSASDFRADDEKGGVGFLSATYLGGNHFYQAGQARLMTDVPVVAGLQKLVSWTSCAATLLPGNNAAGFITSSGTLISSSSGWYMFTLNVEVDNMVASSFTVAMLRYSNNSLSDFLSPKTLAASYGESSSFRPTLRLSGIEFLISGESIAPYYHMNQLSANLLRQSKFSYAFIPRHSSKAMRLYTEDLQPFTGQDEYKLSRWTHAISGLNNVEVLPLMPSVLYILSANLIVKADVDTLSIRSEIMSKSDSLKEGAIYKVHNKGVWTYSFNQIVSIKDFGTLSIWISLPLIKDIVLMPGSSLSLIDLAEGNSNWPRFTKRIHASERRQFGSNRWSLLNSYQLIGSTSFLHSRSVVVVIVPGAYYVSLQLMVAAVDSREIEAGFFVNNEEIDTTRALVSAKDTMTISQIVHLKRGDVLSTHIRASEGTWYTVYPGSTWSVVLVAHLEEAFVPTFPVLVDSLTPSNEADIVPGVGIVLTCDAVAEEDIQYRWFRNYEVLPGHTSDVMRLYGSTKENGAYQCQPVVAGIGQRSESAYIRIFDRNECEDGQHNCASLNMSCVNTAGSYRCVCPVGRVYANGVCLVELNLTDESASKSGEIPVALLVLVPALCVLMFALIAFVIYCLYRRRRREDLDSELVAFTDMEEMGESSGSGNDAASTVSYAATLPVTDENEDDVGGFTEHRGRKLLNATTSV